MIKKITANCLSPPDGKMQDDKFPSWLSLIFHYNPFFMEKTQVNASQHNRFHMHMQKRKGGYCACSPNDKTLQTFEPLVSGEQTHLRRWESRGSEYLQIPIQ